MESKVGQKEITMHQQIMTAPRRRSQGRPVFIFSPNNIKNNKDNLRKNEVQDGGLKKHYLLIDF